MKVDVNFDWKETSVIDIDECEALKGMICTHGKCINLIGGFKCECDVGFQLDKTGNNCTGT